MPEHHTETRKLDTFLNIYIYYFILAYQGHMRASTQDSDLIAGLIGRNTRLSGHHILYMVKQRSTSQKYNHPLASSV